MNNLFCSFKISTPNLAYIFFSTSSLILLYFFLEDIIASFLWDIPCLIGGKVFAENGMLVAPSIISFKYNEYLGRLMRSCSSDTG